MLHSRKLKSQVSEKTLETVYQNYLSRFTGLLQEDNSTTIHIRKTKLVATKLFKVFWKLTSHIPADTPHLTYPRSHIPNTSHLKHLTSQTFHIHVPNILHPQHSTSPTSHIPIITHPKTPNLSDISNIIWHEKTVIGLQELKVASATFGPMTMFKQQSSSFHVVSKTLITQNCLFVIPSNNLCFSCLNCCCLTHFQPKDNRCRQDFEK